MTVSDAISSPAALSAVASERVEEKNTAAAASDTRALSDIPTEQADGTASSPEPRDRFITSEVPIKNALYDVTRVRQGHFQADMPEAYTPETLHGERVSRKIADIPLATGRNLLHIYKAERMPE